MAKNITKIESTEIINDMEKLKATTLRNIHKFIILPLKHIVNLFFPSGKIPKE